MGLQPKQFYRSLDQLLHEIDLGAPGRRWFDSIAQHIVHRFGQELGIENGRVYVEEPAGFRLVLDMGSLDPTVSGLVVPLEYRPIQLLLTHGVFIFDRTTEGLSEDLEKRLGGPESAAIMVKSDPRRILAFGLRPGYERDHLDFALNTIRNAINHRVNIEEMVTDVAQAAEIQRSLLPESSPEFPGFSIAARSLSYTTVGGDFYDFLFHGPQTLAIALGDASGHGLGSALLARDVVTGLRMAAERDLKITATVRRLNRVISKSILSTRFVSLFFCELEQTGILTYVNAGHLPPLILGKNRLARLEVGGMILGPLEDAQFQRGFAQLDPGETLVILTDGFLERENEDGEFFGEKRVLKALRPLAGHPAEEILAALFEASSRYAGGRPWRDDATAVIVSRHR